MNDELIIRPCTAEDEAAIAVLWREIFPNDQPWHDPLSDVRRKTAEHDKLLLVGLSEGVLIATAMAGYDGHRGWLYRLAVDSRHRGRGIGRQMVLAAEDALRTRGCPKLNLQVIGTNRAVVGFYERLGYVIEERVSMGKAL